MQKRLKKPGDEHELTDVGLVILLFEALPISEAAAAHSNDGARKTRQRVATSSARPPAASIARVRKRARRPACVVFSGARRRSGRTRSVSRASKATSPRYCRQSQWVATGLPRNIGLLRLVWARNIGLRMAARGR